jgi:iron complex outermembrane receptor protein
VAAAPADVDLTALPLEQLMALEVSTASRFPQKRTEAPSVVTIVTATDIQAYGYRNFSDILRSIPGLYVTSDRNYDYVGARGFGRPGDYNTRILLLIDGHRMNDNIFDGALVDRSFPLDVDLIERVEFVPGPGSAVYGNNAFFGVVNVITRNGKSVGGLEVAAAAGNSEARSGRLSYGRHTDGGLDLLLSASGYRAEGEDLYYPEFDDPAQNNGVAHGLDYERHKSLFAKVGMDAWTFELAYATRDKGIPTASFDQVFNDPRSKTEDNQGFVSLQYARAWSPDLDVHARVYYSYYSYYGDYIYDYPPITLNRDETYGRWWGGELKLVQRVGARHRLVYGAEHQYDQRQDQHNFDPDTATEYLDDRRRGNRSGVYLQDEIQLRDDLALTVGARYDDFSDGDSATNPRLALIYKASAATAVKAMYGTAYRNPNAYERYYLASPGVYKLSRDLEAETIRTTELAVEHQPDARTRLAASAYVYDIRDLISLRLDPADGLLVFENLDSVSGRGLELQGERLWDSGWRLRASWTVQRAENDADGAELSNSPNHLGKLNVVAPLAGKWRAGTELQYTGARLTKGGETGGYTVVNLTLTAAGIARGLDLSASVYNLFDRDYADPASEELVQDTIPQDGRGWRAKLSYRF